jgi:hypothetical protein
MHAEVLPKLLPNWATIQQARTELPKDGAWEALKHVGVK